MRSNLRPRRGPGSSPPNRPTPPPPARPPTPPPPRRPSPPPLERPPHAPAGPALDQRHLQGVGAEKQRVPPRPHQHRFGGVSEGDHLISGHHLLPALVQDAIVERVGG